jgi:hypothetical protein
MTPSTAVAAKKNKLVESKQEVIPPIPPTPLAPLAVVAEQERRLQELAQREADLERRDQALTREIAASYIGTGDTDALEAEQRAVRVQLQQMRDLLPAVRTAVDQNRLEACETTLSDWITQVAEPAADRAKERLVQHEAHVARLRQEIAEIEAKTEQHRQRCRLLADTSRAFITAFDLDARPITPPPFTRTELVGPKTEPGRLVHSNHLAEAVRAAVAALADDPDGDHALAPATETLLVARPPKDMRTLMREQADRWDAPHRVEIARVDNWLKEQLAAGPVSYDELVERAKDAGIAVRAIEAPDLGWKRASLAHAGKRLGVVPLIQYQGSNFEEEDAAGQWDGDTMYWGLKRVPGLMIPAETLRTARMTAEWRGLEGPEV